MKMHPTLLYLSPLFLFACGGNGPGDATASSNEHLKACDFVTSDQVSQIFGASFKEGELKEHGTGPDEHYFSICVFNGTDPSLQSAVSVMLRSAPEVTDPAAALQAQVDDIRKNAAADYTMDPAPELGPGAGWDASVHQLTLFQRGLMLMVNVQGRGIVGQDMKDRVVQLTKSVLAKLPTPTS